MWISILALIIFVVCVYINVKRGFVKSVMGFLGLFVAVVICISAGDLFTDAMRNTSIGEKARSAMFNSTYESLHNGQEQETADAIDSLMLPGFIKDAAKTGSAAAVGGIYIHISNIVSDMLFNLLCHAVLFVGLLILFAILKKVVPLFAKLPVLKQADKALGFIVGIINGFFMVYLVMLLVSLSISLFNVAWLEEMAQGSYVYKMIYEDNFFIKLFS